MLTQTRVKSRFCVSGPVFEDIHLVDLYLYGSSLFANVFILSDDSSTVIVDTGTSETVGVIENYLHFNGLDQNSILILPTHSHFDHFGGSVALLEYFHERQIDAHVLLTPRLQQSMEILDEYAESAKKIFHDAVGQLEPIPEEFIQSISERDTITLGNNWTMKIIETPGHSEDHLSPYFQNAEGETVCFFGEAMGINLLNDLTPIPAASAPSFNSENYIASINKILQLTPDLGIFSHFGGVCGQENIQLTGWNAKKMLEEFRMSIRDLYESNPHTQLITQAIFNQYAPFIATQSLNKDLARDLTFTIVYGLLQDMGLKQRNNMNISI